MSYDLRVRNNNSPLNEGSHGWTDILLKEKIPFSTKGGKGIPR